MMKFSPSLAAFLLTTTTAIACPIEELHEVADRSLGLQLSKKIDGTEQRSLEGNYFVVYFDRDEESGRDSSGLPKADATGAPVIGVRSRIFAERGQWNYRVVFLDRKTFVIREIEELYEAPLSLNVEVLSVNQRDFVFCGDAPQVPQIIGPSEKSAYLEAAEKARALFFEAPEIADYLKRVKAK